MKHDIAEVTEARLIYFIESLLLPTTAHLDLSIFHHKNQ